MSGKAETIMKTKVIFRQWRDKTSRPLALFPELPATFNPMFCDSWAPSEGHGAADPEGCMKRTRPATSEQVAEMAATLTGGYGYDLQPVERLPRGHYYTRREDIARQSAAPHSA